MPIVNQSPPSSQAPPTARRTERFLLLTGLATVAGVYVASLVFLPELLEPARLVPYTALVVAFAVSVSYDRPYESPLWQRLALNLLRSGLAFVIFLVANASIGLIPALYFIVVPSAYFSLPLRLAGVVALLCVMLVFLGFLIAGDLSSALSMLVPYAGGMAFFAGASIALVQQGRERQRAEQLLAELEEAHARLQEYAIQVEALAVAEERNRLAREIHDSLGHYLTAITRQLEAAAKLLDKQPKKAAASIAKAEDMARESLSEVRRSVAALRASPLDLATLDDAIADLVEATRASGIAATFSTNGEPRRLPSAARVALYRTAQEGLTNVRKHAKASQVHVDLGYEPHQATLCIADNGLGQREERDAGFGLLGLRERLSLLGGSLEAENRSEGGFRLRAVVPTEESTDA